MIIGYLDPLRYIALSKARISKAWRPPSRAFSIWIERVCAFPDLKAASASQTSAATASAARHLASQSVQSPQESDINNWPYGPESCRV